MASQPPLQVHLAEARIYWTPEGGEETELDVREMDISAESDVAEYAGSKSGRWRTARPGGYGGEGSCELNFLRGEPPVDLTRSLLLGRSGTFRVPLYAGGPAFTLPALVTRFEIPLRRPEGTRTFRLEFRAGGPWTFDAGDVVVVDEPEITSGYGGGGYGQSGFGSVGEGGTDGGAGDGTGDGTGDSTDGDDDVVLVDTSNEFGGSGFGTGGFGE